MEMAVTLPFLLLLVLGMVQLGWLLLNSIAVVNATSEGARFFASQRGASTPYTSTQAQVRTAASLLTPAGLTVKATVNGVSCRSDASCAAALASASDPLVNMPATVSITYSDFHPLFVGALFGLGSIMPSTLSSTLTERVQ